MNAKDQLRQKIRDMREDKQMTQAEMAELLHMSETGYAKIERGESSIRIERLDQIAQVFGVSIADLIPFNSDGGIVFNNSNENFSNSSNFTVALGASALEAEVAMLQQHLEAKDAIILSREREIEVLRQQIVALEKLVAVLEKKPL